VQAGDKILTSGEDHIFPKDMPVGTVESAKQGNPFQVIWIQPAARLDRLEDVLVLLTQEFAPKKNEQASAPNTTATTPAANGAAASSSPN
jgi:cell shape-determining protein MreC